MNMFILNLMNGKSWNEFANNKFLKMPSDINWSKNVF